MKTLEEHNIQALELHLDSNKPRPNGIECPKCKSELYDSAPRVMLTSYPPKKEVHCEKCDYHGYRY